MKRILVGVFIISVISNMYLTKKYLIEKKRSSLSLYNIKSIDKLTGLKEFEDKLIEINPTIYKTKKHFLIQVWDPITCNFEENKTYMQLLDSIANNYKNDSIGFVFTSEMDDEAIEVYCQKHEMNFKNFTFINDANDFISSVFIQKKLKFKKHPAQFIMNKNGDIEYYKTTAFSDVIKDTILINNLNKFNL